MPLRRLARRSTRIFFGSLALMVMAMLTLTVIDAGQDLSDCNILLLACRPALLMKECFVLPARLGKRHLLRVRSVIALFLHPYHRRTAQQAIGNRGYDTYHLEFWWWFRGFIRRCLLFLSGRKGSHH